MDKINLSEKLSQFSDRWTPKVIAELNGQQVKLAKLHGEFVWHDHPDEDEFFLVLEGELIIRLPDEEVVLGPGECFVVPRGVRHQPVAESEAHVLLFEPAGTINTGTEGGPRTVRDLESI